MLQPFISLRITAQRKLKRRIYNIVYETAICPNTPVNNFIGTYLLTPWCRVLPEQLTGLQLDKKFPAFHGTLRFITALTSVRHLSLSWASPIQSTCPHPTSWRSILILSTHLRLGLPSGLFPSGFPTKNLYTHSPHPYAMCPVHLIFLDFRSLILTYLLTYSMVQSPS